MTGVGSDKESGQNARPEHLGQGTLRIGGRHQHCAKKKERSAQVKAVDEPGR